MGLRYLIMNNRRGTPVSESSMKKLATPKPARKPRSDAPAQSRAHPGGREASLHPSGGADAGRSRDREGRTAKIGPGTRLYRHFATRDDLLATVYITEVEKLAAAQEKIIRRTPPIEALQAWLVVFIDYIAAKKIIQRRH